MHDQGLMLHQGLCVREAAAAEHRNRKGWQQQQLPFQDAQLSSITTQAFK